MSFQAMTWAVAQKTRNAGQKLVLLMLANYCNSHTGQCNPSHKRLADECAMGVSTLKGHIQALADEGFLRVIPKYADGVALPNQYALNLGGVGQNLAGGGSDSDGGVGQNLATNQEVKPGIEPPPTPQGVKEASPPGFELFWLTWPKSQRKGGKAQCLSVWNKAKLEPEAGRICAHVQAMIQSADWKKNDGEFIPAPVVYLRGSRWDGAEIIIPVQKKPWDGAL